MFLAGLLVHRRELGLRELSFSLDLYRFIGITRVKCLKFRMSLGGLGVIRLGKDGSHKLSWRANRSPKNGICIAYVLRHMGVASADPANPSLLGESA